MAADAIGPLAGIKVVDFSRVLAGPHAAMTLADLGADVVKIEHPVRGDDTRQWGTRIGETETAYYYSVNRGKRSMTLDLQSQTGQQIARELAAGADVVIENFKVGGMARLGLDHETLRKANPGLIYCSISGYHPDGPEATRPGYDLVIQGQSGLMAMNGEAGQQRLKFGVAVVDLFTGMYAAQAIMAALIERSRTGIGRRIQLALFECGLMLTAYCGMEALIHAEDPPRYGNAHPSVVPYGVFDAVDGPIVLTVGNDSQFRRLCRDVIGSPETAEDPRFATNLTRAHHRAELLVVLESALRQRSRADLIEALQRAGIPCGEVLGLYEALSSERTRGTDIVREVSHPVAGGVPVFAAPFNFDGRRCTSRLPPPMLGEHTDEILRERLGRSAEDAAALREGKII